MKYFIGIIGLLILGGVGWYSLHTSTTTDSQNTSISTEGVRVATSIYPLAYITERLLGDAGIVTNVGAGQDPHDFRPSVRDIQTMQDADLVLLQGAGLEPWGEDIVMQLQNKEVPVLVVNEELDLYEQEESHDSQHKDHTEDSHGHPHDDDHSHGHEDEHHHDIYDQKPQEDHHDHGAFDPHTWLDPVLMSQTAVHIFESLIAVDPSNHSVYKQNLASLQLDLGALDTEYKQALSLCGIDEVITSHDAFGYLGRRYGFEIHTIGGLSTQDTPSALTLANLKEEVAEGITTILLEENSIAAYGETLARETGLKTASINPIVYNLPEGQDYISIMRSNLDTLASALNCNE